MYIFCIITFVLVSLAFKNGFVLADEQGSRTVVSRAEKSIENLFPVLKDLSELNEIDLIQSKVNKAIEYVMEAKLLLSSGEYEMAEDRAIFAENRIKEIRVEIEEIRERERKIENQAFRRKDILSILSFIVGLSLGVAGFKLGERTSIEELLKKRPEVQDN